MGNLKKIFTTLLLVFTGLGAVAQVTDIDGNVYSTVQIGTQLWMSENLKVVRFSNGDSIPYATGNVYYPAWLYFGNSPANGAIYGRLYTGYVVADTRNVCPTNWHVPTLSDWSTLVNYLGQPEAGKKMKTDIGWNGTNASGFTGLPGGFLFGGNFFMLMGTHGYWWSSTAASGLHQHFVIAQTFMDSLQMPGGEQKFTAMNIRCVNDSTFAPSSIQESGSLEQLILVSPNPTSDFVTIANLPNTSIILITDITGKEVFNAVLNIDQVTVKTSDFMNGVYIIRIQSNGSIINKKLVVNR